MTVMLLSFMLNLIVRHFKAHRKSYLIENYTPLFIFIWNLQQDFLGFILILCLLAVLVNVMIP